MGGDAGGGSSAANTASVSSTILTVMANLVGAGLLSLPYTLKRAGLIPGVIAMCVMAAANSFSMILIARCCELAQAFSYKDLGATAFGKAAGRVISGVMALYTLGSCVSFCVLLGDFLPDLVCEDGCITPGQVWFGNRARISAIVAFLILFPLSLARNLSALKFTSTLSTVCIVYASLMIAIRAIVGSPSRAPPSEVNYKGGGTGIFVSFPIMVVAFTLHYNVARYYEELKDRSLPKFTGITAVSFGAVLILYLATAIGGYLLFGNSTSSDILLNFASNDAAAVVARVALSAIVIGCYPLAFNSFRSSVTALLPEVWARRVREPLELSVKKANGHGRDADDLNNHLVSHMDGAPAEIAVVPVGAAAPAQRRGVGGTLYTSVPTEDSANFGDVAAAKGSSGSPWSDRLQRAWLLVQADWPHGLLTLILVGASLGIGLGVPNIGTVLSYKGALGGSLIVFVFPGWMYFMLTRAQSGVAATATWPSMARDLVTTGPGLTAFVMTLWGAAMMILGTLSTAGVLKSST